MCSESSRNSFSFLLHIRQVFTLTAQDSAEKLKAEISHLRKRNRILVVLSLIVMVLVSLIPLTPQVHAVGEYEYFDNTGIGYIYAGIDSVYWMAQLFTVGATGHTVTSVHFYSGIQYDSPTCYLSIRATSGGVPVTPDLTTGSVAVAAGWNTVSVTELTLTANTQYAIVVDFPAGSSGDCFYVGGVSTGGDGNFCSSSTSGVNGGWTKQSGYEMAYEIWGNAFGSITVNTATHAWNVIPGQNNASLTTVQGSWTMFGGDLAHTRYSPSTAPNTNATAWIYSFTKAINSPPTVSGGMVYVGCYDHCVYCLNEATGALVWSSAATSGNIWTAIAIADGYAFATACGGVVYCYNATTGTQVWNHTLTAGQDIYTSPAVANGLVYTSCDDGYIYALNEADGSQNWTWNVGTWVESSIAVSGGDVYFASGNTMKVYALNALTGAFIWVFTFEHGNVGFSSPSVVNGVVYVGSHDQYMYALNASTGAKIWSAGTGAYVASSPAVANGFVYCGSGDNYVYCWYANNGTQKWSYPTTAGIIGSPSVADGKVFIGSGDGIFYVLNATTGALVWEYVTGGGIQSSPAIVDGLVFIGSGDHNLYAFGTPPAIMLTVTAPANFDIQVKGSADLSDGSGHTIALSNLLAGEYVVTNSVALTTSYQTVPGLSTVASGTSLPESFYLWLSCPMGTAAGVYTYTLTIQVTPH